MPIQGEIVREGQPNDTFEIPDPKKSGEMVSARLQIQPGIWRRIIWAPSHMIPTGGGGRAYLKYDVVGKPIGVANLPRRDATDSMTDTETGIVINLTRT